MSDLSPEQVRSEIQRFWAILTGVSKDKLEGLYSSDAIVFTGSGKQSDPANLVSVRRARQRAAAAPGSTAELGRVEVQVVTPDVAVATYTYRFHTSTVHEDGSQMQKHTTFGRATQVFQRDGTGALRIVHEHLSSASPAKIEKRGRP
jgi:ketosteroid isomerase-like protein